MDLHRLRELGRVEPWRCAYAGGTFDVLHRGHLALFARCKSIATALVVSVNTDDFAARYKRRPLQPLADRMAVLFNCRLVDRVIVNVGDEDSTPAILQSGCDVIVHGSDWTAENGLLEQMGLTRAWLQAQRIDLVTLPYTEFVSTTQLLQAHQRAPLDVETYLMVDQMATVSGLTPEQVRASLAALKRAPADEQARDARAILRWFTKRLVEGRP